MSVQEVRLSNGWQHRVSDREERFPPEAIDQAQALLGRWAPIFPVGQTWVGRELGVPSIIVRLDCVFRNDLLQVMEIEERPCGIGVTRQLNPQFARELGSRRLDWPDFAWVHSDNRVTDDDLWLEGLTVEQAHAETDRLLLVRARPEDAEARSLERRAVSSAVHEGDKRYGVALGLWRIVEWVNGAENAIVPTIEGPTVIKPVQGTRARNIGIFIPQEHRRDLVHIKEKDDLIGTQRLETIMRQRGRMVAQPFIRPMQFGHLPNMNAIYRFYFGFRPGTGYLPMGGMWVATKSLIVHGHERAVIGPLIF